MTVRLKALKAFPYAGKRIPLGQEFDARGESDAKVLCAIRSAERVKVTVAAPMYNTRMMVAQTPQHVVPEAVHPVDVPYVTPDEFAAIVAGYLKPEPNIARKAEAVVEMKETFAPDSVPAPESDLDGLDRPALFDLAVSMGMKPHHLMGVAKLRAAIEARRAE